MAYQKNCSYSYGCKYYPDLSLSHEVQDVQHLV